MASCEKILEVDLLRMTDGQQLSLEAQTSFLIKIWQENIFY